MQFQLFHKKYFNALEGSYSIVTEREEFDSQITLTDVETEMVIQYFGRSNINIGKVALDPLKSQKDFLLYPDFQTISLNLVFPKLDKTELRLYISSKAGFKPKSGEIWFLYLNDIGQLVIGSLSESVWNSLDQNDIEDDEYLVEIQDKINEEKNIIIPTPEIVERVIGAQTVFKRNPLIAVASLKKANFTCEVDPTHTTFIAEKSKAPYVEAHHFVPMKFQADFRFPLDNVDNVISLCPNCHRGIHLGIIDYKKTLIKSIYDSRKAINDFNIEEMYSFYNTLKINN